jgi:hydrogenase-4 component B
MLGDLFFVLAIICALSGSLLSAACNRNEWLTIRIAFISTIIAASCGIATTIIVLISGPFTLNFLSTPFGDFGFTVDKLSAFFLLAICTLTIPVSIFSLDYVTEYSGKYSLGLMGFLYNLFFLSMITVVTANNAIFFLVCWEVMSLSSYLLVVYENRKKEVIFAGALYVIMTHIGTACIIISFLIMGGFAGSFSFAAFQNLGATLPDVMKGVLFVLLLIGFGMKSGMMPLHVWLPYAHPAAPSNISAQMSGVMIKTAIFMMIRTFFVFLGPADLWWGIVVLSVGCLSAVMGVMYAYVDSDLKRLLAYHSVENIGIILIALGIALIFQSVGLVMFASLALIACLFHVFNHSLFKGLLFLGAGAILHSTHTKNIEELGGLVKKMPQTAGFFLIGCLAISAIPPFNGFVSEWLVFQSLFFSFNISNLIVDLFIPLAIGILALTGGLAVGCFVHTFGITFLALPRSEHAEHAKEAPATMRVGMGILAVLCFVVGILGGFFVLLLDGVTSSITNVSIGPLISDGFVINAIPASFGGMSPLLLAIAMAALVVGIWLSARHFGGKEKVEIADTWDCGTPLSPRNEYTAVGYAQPVDRVFGGVYRPTSQITTVNTTSPYIFKEKKFEGKEKIDLYETYFFGPVARGIKAVANWVKRIQNGSISAYLCYILVALVIVLIFFVG